MQKPGGSAPNSNLTANKKACYLYSSRLFNAHKAYLVGCAGVEPTTNGLKVRFYTYFPLLINVATIHVNQQLTSSTLDR